MAARGWVPWVIALCGAVAACSLTVGKADLESVQCSEDQAIGPPACAAGQICLQGRCQRCAAVDLCGDGLDNDCRNGADDGCSGSGGSGGSSQGGNAGEGGGQGGQGGMDASPDQSNGGSSGQGGEGGSAHGGASGTGGDPGAGGTSTGGTGEGGSGTGGAPPLKFIGETCGGNGECASGRCVADVGPAAGSACTNLCCSSADCPSNFGCAPAGAGNLCMAANRMGAASAGTGALGAPCTKSDQCISLRCDTGAQKCSDACCSNDNCGGGTCGYGSSTWSCSAEAPNKGDMADCSSAVCDSHICSASKYCMGPCCTDADCSGLHICEYALVGGEAVRACMTTLPSSDTPCCTDAQCGGGQRCTYVEEDFYNPLPVTKWVLRCK